MKNSSYPRLVFKTPGRSPTHPAWPGVPPNCFKKKGPSEGISKKNYFFSGASRRPYPASTTTSSHCHPLLPLLPTILCLWPQTPACGSSELNRSLTPAGRVSVSVQQAARAEVQPDDLPRVEQPRDVLEEAWGGAGQKGRRGTPLWSLRSRGGGGNPTSTVARQG